MGGLVYFWLQPSGGRRGGVVVNIPSAPVTLTPNDSGSPLGNGDDVVMKKYDQRTGELASEFLAKEYKPQRGGQDRGQGCDGALPHDQRADSTNSR